MSFRSDKDIFFEALDLATQEEVATFLSAACAGDSEKRARLDELLAGHFARNAFMEAPAADDSQRSSFPIPDDEPGKVIGRYTLREKLGEGGFGVVYVAEQREPVKRRVALKIIKLGMDTRQVVARFEAERQALAMMEHPNIAKVFDAGATETGRPYFVMELVRGVRITDYCKENDLSIEERLKLFMQICQAIQHAHQKGIIHRDIKPSNILITSDDGAPMPKVIDFGIAKAIETDLTDKTVYTQFHQFIGTPAYMSPEQAEMNSHDVDTRTDIYALGVLLYELLTGHTPFESKDLLQSGLEQMRKTIREKEPVRPSTRLRQIQIPSQSPQPARPTRLAVDLDWIVMKCLEKDRTRRYPSANDLALDLARHLKNEVVLAAAPTNAYRLRKFYQRHKGAVFIGGIFLALMVAGVAAAIALTIRARKAERVAEQNLYGGNMQLIQQAWERGDPLRVRQLLQETSRYPARGFEWFYWHRQMHTSLRELRGHSGALSHISFSPDGSKTITSAEDSTAIVWDTETGRQLMVLKTPSWRVANASFSPDGRRILTTDEDGAIRISDAGTGRELLKVGQYGPAWFSPDGNRILAQGRAGGGGATLPPESVAVLDSGTGQELIRLVGQNAGVCASAWSGDGKRAATCGYDTLKVWDTSTGEELLTIGIFFRSVAISPDGEIMVAAANSGGAYAIKLSTREQLPGFTIAPYHGSPIVFSPDGRMLAAMAADRLVTVRNPLTGLELCTVKSPAPVSSIAFSPDGRLLALANTDGIARFWDISDNGATLMSRVVKLPGTFVYNVDFSPDGATLVSSSADGLARLWDVQSGSRIGVLRGHSSELSAAAFFPDGRRIVTASADHTAKVWDIDAGQELLSFRGHNAPVFSTRVFAGGHNVLTRSSDGVAKVWEATTGEELLTLQCGSVTVSSDGQRIATGDAHENVTRIRDLAQGRELFTIKGSGPIAFSPDGSRIITCGNVRGGDFAATISDAKKGRSLVKLRGHNGPIHSFDFSKDGKRILTASSDSTARLWDAENGKELITFRGHAGVVSRAVFSPDNQRIATSSHDTTLRIWEASPPAETTETEPAILIVPAAGFHIEWDRKEGSYFNSRTNAAPPGNDALATKGAIPIGSSQLAFGPLHYIQHINDGFYGNTCSWISASGLGDTVDPHQWIGVIFPKRTSIGSVAWGRDNGNDLEKQFTDRAVGAYTLQFTRISNPSTQTAETGDASTGWQTIGTVRYLSTPEALEFSAWLRHQFAIAENGKPVLATALRLVVSDGRLCIDELEINPSSWGR